MLLPAPSDGLRAITMQLEKSVTVEPGKATTLTMLFFNVDTPEGIPVQLSWQAPPGWNVSLSAAGFVLQPSAKENGDAYYALGDSYLRSHKVTAKVSVPFDAEEQAYDIDIYAALAPGSAAAIKVNQERHMNFKVRVAKQIVPSPGILEQILGFIPNTITGLIAQAPKALAANATYLLGIVLLALAAIYLFMQARRR
ncbi:MAG: hypothetical protein HY519_02625 [Candidatus Aenigmarchaeota archaeon]|nr:hypothetical protein [Candidatus Aenigmarchaeota archaeon]